MKTYIITYDSASPYWNRERQYNLMFIRQQEFYFNSLLENRGYVYMNQIYEAFGVKWDPKNQNPCLMSDECKILEFVIDKVSPYVYNITIQVR